MTPALIQRVESARGPDRELDAIIWCALEHPDRTPSKNFFYTRDEWGFFRTNQPEPGTTFYDAPHFTSSLDAAVSLCARVLPGWGWRCGQGVTVHWLPDGRSVTGWAFLNRTHPDHCDKKDESGAWAESAPLALVLAVLRAVTP